MRRKTFTLVIEDNYVNLRIVASLTIKKTKMNSDKKFIMMKSLLIIFHKKHVNNGFLDRN